MTRTVLVAAALCLTLAACSSATSSSAPATSTDAASPSSTTPTPTPTPTPSPTPSAPTFAGAFAAVRGSGVRSDQTDCAGGGSSGSGFVVAPGLVATVAHVVDGAHSVSVRVGKGVTHGTVVGIDRDKDLALVRLKNKIGGPALRWAPLPTVGTEVAVVGHPFGEPLTMTGGRVNALDVRVEMESQSLTHMVKYDAATNGGNSGGPLITADGRVVGLVDAKRNQAQGESFAIPASQATDPINLWLTNTDPPQPLASCPDPWRDLVTLTSNHADGPAMALTFYRYFSGINSGTWANAVAMLTGAARGRFGGVDGFAAKFDGSTVSDVRIEDAHLVTNTSDRVVVSYRIAVDGGTEATSSCEDMHVQFIVRNDTGWWHIDTEKVLPDSTQCFTNG